MFNPEFNPSAVQSALELFRSECARMLIQPGIKNHLALGNDVTALTQLLTQERNNYTVYQTVLGYYEQWRELPEKVILVTQLLNCLYYAVSFTPVRDSIANAYLAYQQASLFEIKSRRIAKAKQLALVAELETLFSSLFDLHILFAGDPAGYVELQQMNDRKLNNQLQRFLQNAQGEKHLPATLVTFMEAYQRQPYAVNKGHALSVEQARRAHGFFQALSATYAPAGGAANRNPQMQQSLAQSLALMQAKTLLGVQKEFVEVYQALLASPRQHTRQQSDIVDLKKYRLLIFAITNQTELMSDLTQFVDHQIYAALMCTMADTEFRKALFQLSRNLKALNPAKKAPTTRALMNFIERLDTHLDDPGQDDNQLYIFILSENFAAQDIQGNARLPANAMDMIDRFLKRGAPQSPAQDASVIPVGQPGPALPASPSHGASSNSTSTSVGICTKSNTSTLGPEANLQDINQLPILDTAKMLEYLEEAYQRTAMHWLYLSAITGEEMTLRKTASNNLNVANTAKGKFFLLYEKHAAGPAADANICQPKLYANRPSFANITLDTQPYMINLTLGFEIISRCYFDLSTQLTLLEQALNGDDAATRQKRGTFQEKIQDMQRWHQYYNMVAQSLKQTEQQVQKDADTKRLAAQRDAQARRVAEERRAAELRAAEDRRIAQMRSAAEERRVAAERDAQRLHLLRQREDARRIREEASGQVNDQITEADGPPQQNGQPASNGGALMQSNGAAVATIMVAPDHQADDTAAELDDEMSVSSSGSASSSSSSSTPPSPSQSSLLPSSPVATSSASHFSETAVPSVSTPQQRQQQNANSSNLPSDPYSLNSPEAEFVRAVTVQAAAMTMVAATDAAGKAKVAAGEAAAKTKVAAGEAKEKAKVAGAVVAEKARTGWGNFLTSSKNALDKAKIAVARSTTPATTTTATVVSAAKSVAPPTQTTAGGNMASTTSTSSPSAATVLNRLQYVALPAENGAAAEPLQSSTLAQHADTDIAAAQPAVAPPPLQLATQAATATSSSTQYGQLPAFAPIPTIHYDQSLPTQPDTAATHAVQYSMLPTPQGADANAGTAPQPSQWAAAPTPQ